MVRHSRVRSLILTMDLGYGRLHSKTVFFPEAAPAVGARKLEDTEQEYKRGQNLGNNILGLSYYRLYVVATMVYSLVVGEMTTS